ncbi:MAG: M67 family metallopeptidase [Candidatus Hydrogenedentota bacterium]
MPITLTSSNYKTIAAHGESTFPHECCGFMLGKANGAERQVRELLSAENEREDGARHNRFVITPEAYLRGDKAARAKGLDIIGFYHSHPNAPAKPSQYDLDHAWPWYSYVIVSIQDGKAADMTSWVLAEDRREFGQEEIVQEG